MAPADTVLVIHSDGTASLVAWPVTDDERRAVIAAEIGASQKMRRCGKGILGFVRADETTGGESGPALGDVNTFAAAAYAEQGVDLETELRGPVLFARNPSKGSVVKPLTAAQTANLLVVTGAHVV
jgi:hypothetical protein